MQQSVYRNHSTSIRVSIRAWATMMVLAFSSAFSLPASVLAQQSSSDWPTPATSLQQPASPAVAPLPQTGSLLPPTAPHSTLVAPQQTGLPLNPAGLSTSASPAFPPSTGHPPLRMPPPGAREIATEYSERPPATVVENDSGNAPFLFSAAGDVAANPNAEKELTTEEKAEAIAAKAKEKAAEASSRFSRALSGDRTAMREIFAEYLIPAVIALLTLIIGFMVASFFGRIVGETVSSRVDLTLGKFTGRAIRNAILLIVVLGVLGQFGIDVTSIAAVFAAAGFAIGMALQGTLSNFAAGIMLMVFRPFNVGDYIKVAGIEGRVDEIDLFTTKLDTLDNRRLIVPNGEVFGSVIENCTRNEVRRVDVSIGVSYDADLRLTRQVLSDATAVIPGAVTRPEPEVYLDSLGASSVDWQIRVWCRPENFWDVKQRVTMAAKDALDASGISIPYPQLDLHVVSGLAVPAASDPNPVRRAA